jgi:hypothetical protein
MGKWGDIVGVCIAPVTAQVIMTFLCFDFVVLIDSFLIDESTHTLPTSVCAVEINGRRTASRMQE